MDESKAAAASESMSAALEGPLIDKITFKRRAPRVPTYESRATPKSSAIQSAEENCIGGPGRRIQQSPNNKMQARQGGGARQMERLMDSMEELEVDPDLEGKVQVRKVNDHEVMIRLTSAGLFPSGRADPMALDMVVLGAIAKKLEPYPDVQVRVEGHTDNVPISGSFASNWELSSARAGSVVRALVSSFGLEPLRMMAAGYGEHRPVAGNDTVEGRAANRRIDILIRHPNAPGSFEATGFSQVPTERDSAAAAPAPAPSEAAAPEL
jgi:chemotaxis protein MotB